MSNWREIFVYVHNLLTDIWHGIFGIELFDGLTAQILLVGVFAVSVGLGIWRFILSNTHADPGPISTYTVSSTLSHGHDSHGEPFTSDVTHRTLTKSYRR